MEKYEEQKDRKSNQVGELAHIRLISGGSQGQGQLKEKLSQMTTSQTNPIKHINNWVKGEVFGLEALIFANNQKDLLEKAKSKARSDIKDIEDTIEKLSQGKFTFGGIFKSNSEKQESAITKAAIKVQLEQDLVNYDVLKKFLTIYLATVAIPQFKKQRVESYVRAMGKMCDEEVKNANSILDCWSGFQQLISSYRIK